MSRFSVLLLDKKEGETSFKSLSQVKREYKGSKVGHAGTLDKFATGLMLVLTGEATRLNPLFSGMDKSYRAAIRFGSETDTLDPEGEVIATSSIPSLETVESVIRSFVGTQEQVPPVYSAIHVDGKRAYQSARQGKSVDMPTRSITVYSAKLISYTDGLAIVDFSVSKGTYIRSLARDIGLRSSSRAHLEKLDRFTLGPYSKSDIGKDTDKLLEMLPLGRIDFSSSFQKTLKNGYFDKKGILSLKEGDNSYFMLYIDNEFIGIISKDNGKYSIIALKNREEL